VSEIAGSLTQWFIRIYLFHQMSHKPFSLIHQDSDIAFLSVDWAKHSIERMGAPEEQEYFVG